MVHNFISIKFIVDFMDFIINLMKYSKLILIVALLGFVQLQQVNGVVERGKNYAIPPAPPMLANLSDPERR